MKYLYNPATDSFEALEPTLRDRFALGGRVNFSEGTEIPFVEPEAVKFTTDPNRVGPKGGYRVSIIRGGKSFDKTFLYLLMEVRTLP